jgi:uroporphyrin-III C-methyltransferase / precorrin-2 dehydrogenase / sirohydrochlorin ferrochelatase
VTAAQGAASRLQISLTHRELARRVQFVTGHAHDGKLPDDLDWASLSDPSAVTAIYMPTRTLEEFSQRAMAAGLDPATPAIAIRNATRKDETTIRATLEQLPKEISTVPGKGPLLVLIGQALSKNENLTQAESGELLRRASR